MVTHMLNVPHPPKLSHKDYVLEYEASLNSFLPKFFWFRDRHYVDGNRIKIWGTIVLPQGRIPDLKIRLNGKPVAGQYPIESAYGQKTFWFVPSDRCFGVSIEGEFDPASQYSIVTICPSDTHEAREQEFSFALYHDWGVIHPTPPIAKIERVSGKGATEYNYYNNGLSDYLRFLSIAERHGIRTQEVTTKILDWGCGCGRLTRHLMALPGGRNNVVGIDIDGDNIDWCKQNLCETMFARVDLYPPTSLKDQSFDLIIANSVLSHLQLNAMKAWLAEVQRLLKPGGLALLSYNGQFMLCGTASRTQSFVDSVIQSGFDASRRAPELDSIIGDKEYYRNTFMTDEFARQLFSSHFTVEEQIPAVVSRFENVAVLRASRSAFPTRVLKTKGNIASVKRYSRSRRRSRV